jgi:hypothetical protein
MHSTDMPSLWPRHLRSLRRHGITVHGVWIDTGAGDHRVIALIGYPPDSNPASLAEIYRATPDFVEDHAAFDVSLVISAHTAKLEPISDSPL